MERRTRRVFPNGSVAAKRRVMRAAGASRSLRRAERLSLRTKRRDPALVTDRWALLRFRLPPRTLNRRLVLRCSVPPAPMTHASEQRRRTAMPRRRARRRLREIRDRRTSGGLRSTAAVLPPASRGLVAIWTNAKAMSLWLAGSVTCRPTRLDPVVKNAVAIWLSGPVSASSAAPSPSRSQRWVRGSPSASLEPEPSRMTTWPWYAGLGLALRAARGEQDPT